MKLRGKDPEFGGTGKDLESGADGKSPDKGPDMAMPGFASGNEIKPADADSLPRTAADLKNPFAMGVLTALASYVNGLAKSPSKKLNTTEIEGLREIRKRLEILARAPGCNPEEFGIHELIASIYTIISNSILAETRNIGKDLLAMQNPVRPTEIKDVKIPADKPKAAPVKPAPMVEATQKQTRSKLLEFMRANMSFLSEAAIASLAARFSRAAQKQLTQELRTAIKQRRNIVTEIGKTLMPKQADKISYVSNDKAEIFVIIANNQPSVWKVKFSNALPPFTDFVLTKNDKEVFEGSTVEDLIKSITSPKASAK